MCVRVYEAETDFICTNTLIEMWLQGEKKGEN